MTASWRHDLEATLGAVKRIEPVRGGSINEACRVELAGRRFVFVKWHASPPPGMYAAEAAGLAWLRGGPLRVPRVIAAADSFLALEWLEPETRSERLDAVLGRGLAGLHALGAPSFGLDRDNYLATIRQDNTPEPDIQTFWIERRLRPLFEQIRLADGMADLRRGLDTLRARPELFGPPEPPARLHGDLWGGNVFYSDDQPVLIDPAVYGGHREIDLAMLALFGSLSPRTLDAYQEVATLADGWRTRVKLWQLYPLAAHAVLFGGGYVKQTAAALAELAELA